MLRGETVQACLRLLEGIPPLREDCGRLCTAACCRSLPGEETGMLLFPGEEETCRSLPGFRLKPTAQGTLALCPGTCDRSTRPLACRMFPLIPLLRGERVRVAADARARAVCPLARQGVRACLPEFVEAVRACGELLAEDPEGREILREMTRRQDDLTALQRQFGGG